MSFPVDGTADSYIVRFRVRGVINDATCASEDAPAQAAFTCSVDGGVLSWTDQGADRYFVREVNGGEDSFVGGSVSLSFPVDGTADSYIVRFRVGDVVNDATCASAAPDQDGDGVPDAIDNCPAVPNADQAQTLAHIADLIGTAGDACLDIDENGVPDLTQDHICIATFAAGDALPVILIAEGSPDCSAGSPTAGLNTAIAIAIGDDPAVANARSGSDNTAIAIGRLAVADAREGDHNTAIARGDGAEALAGIGDGNLASATGFFEVARAAEGNNNTAIALSTVQVGGAVARAELGDNNTAIATVTGFNGVANATASVGDNNTSTATSVGDGTANAQARGGDNNSATASASAFGEGFATAGGDNLVISNDNTACAGPGATVGARAGGETVIEGCFP